MTPRPVLWVLGDSWADPRDPENIAAGWPQQVAARLGLGLVCSAVWGAGYLSQGGDEGSTFPVQAARGWGAGAAAVVVWGSVNDRTFPPADVRRWAAETYRLLRAACPGAPLLVAGPQHWDTPPAAALEAVRDAVRDAARDAAAPFLDPLLWTQGRPDLLDGSAHPGPGAHALIADRVTAALAVALTGAAAGPPLPDPGGGWSYSDGARTYPPDRLVA